MKKMLYLLLGAVLPGFLQAQTVSNAENFQIGTVLTFQECSAAGVSPGNAGANQVWNFANLTALPNTNTEWIEAPATTPFAATFPNANLVEKYSDGSYVYINKTATANYMVGYADPGNNVTIHYPNTLLFTSRPVTYGATLTDPFTTNYTAAGFYFRGKGISEITADGYGTLILPNGTFNNVLRVKLSSNQTDTLLQFNSVSNTVSTTYAWFDGVHTSALLKITNTVSGSFTEQTVNYLLSETSSPTGISRTKEALPFTIAPNPAHNYLNFSTTKPGNLTFTDPLGRTLKTVSVSSMQTKIETETLPSGLYQLSFQNETGTYRSKILIRH